MCALNRVTRTREVVAVAMVRLVSLLDIAGQRPVPRTDGMKNDVGTRVTRTREVVTVATVRMVSLLDIAGRSLVPRIFHSVTQKFYFLIPTLIEIQLVTQEGLFASSICTVFARCIFLHPK